MEFAIVLVEADKSAASSYKLVERPGLKLLGTSSTRFIFFLSSFLFLLISSSFFFRAIDVISCDIGVFACV